MTEEGQPSRRTFLQGVGVLSAVGLAGCSLGANPDVRTQQTPVEIEVNRTATPTPTAAGGGMSAPAEEAPPELAASATVEAVATDSGFAFEPSVVHVKPGATVTWEMVDSVHTVTAYHADNGKPNRMPPTATPFDSGMLSEGDTFEHTFDSEGVYDYYCLPHEGMGMVGSVVVGMPSPDTQPGLAPPQESLPQPAREAILELNKTANAHLNAHGGHEAHGGDGEDAASTGNPARTLTEEAEVSIVPAAEDHAFDPPVVQVATGGSVTWTSTEGTHCATAYHPENDAPLRIPEDAEPWDSGRLEEGESFTQTFAEPGIYDYFCPMHQERGAVGTVVVGDLGDQPGLAPPQAELPSAAAEALSKLNRQAPELFYGATPSEKTVDASAEVVEGEITLFVTAVNGEVGPGSRARVVAWVDNHRLVNAPVTVNDERVGTTDERGALVVTLPTDTATVRIEAFAGVATGGTTLTLGSGAAGGADSGAGGNAAPEPLPQSVTIEAVQTADGYAFEPAVAHVAAGGTITWKMVDGVHTTTAYATANGKPQRIPGGGTAWDSGILQTGDSFEQTLGTEGVYDYFCLPHEGMGMVGTVVVGRPSPEGQPGLAAPQSDLPAAAQSALTSLNGEAETLLANTGGSGGSGGTGGSPPNQQPDQPSNGEPALPTEGDVTVRLVATGDGYAFDPPVQQLQPGQTVEWQVVDGTHDIEAYAPANDRPRRIPNAGLAWRSGMMGPGESFAFTIDAPGVYDYFCRPHEGSGMVGSLVVGTPSPDGQPGLAPPQSSLPDRAETTLTSLNDQARSLLENGGNAGSGGGSGGSGGSGQPATHTVTVGANGGKSFSPELIHVDVGDTVRWEWAEAGHTVTSYSSDNGKPDRIPSGASGFDSGFASAAGFEHTFTTAGKYDYFCLPHEGGGMVASVLVGSPDPATDPGFQPAQSSIDADAGNALDALTTRAEEMLAGGGSGGGNEGGSGGSGGDDTGSGGSSSCEEPVVDAASLSAQGTIDIVVTSTEVAPGDTARLVARYDGQRLANAPVDVDGDPAGSTNGCGELTFTVPNEDSFRIEIRVGDARGRTEVTT
ncbi:plastocyanin/azurin family copper-binding protein [Natronomonas sp. EA1]|uniref:plastocyanin/azurin family copper-binding protein n=1 Tax=Natronomonas sp. EA1 TaxID=3421655 RepID=UPI003EB9672C